MKGKEGSKGKEGQEGLQGTIFVIVVSFFLPSFASFPPFPCFPAFAAEEPAPPQTPDRSEEIQERLNRGKRYMLMGRYRQAILEFEQVLELDPQNREAATVLAKARRSKEDAEKTLAQEIQRRNGAGPPQPPAQPSAPPQEIPPAEGDFIYRIQPGDQLQVLVYRVPDLTRNVLVRPDGRISFPLAGELYVSGKTLVELREMLRAPLSKYLRNPEIEVNVVSLSQQKIIVLGEVNAPGVYTFPGREMPLAEVLALARGANSRAHLKSIMVVPLGASKPVDIRRVNFHAFLKHRTMDQNPIVSAGSLIYVPRSFIGTINQFVDDVAGPAYRVGVTSAEIDTSFFHQIAD